MTLKGTYSKLADPILPVPVTSKADEDPIKNERAIFETPFSHYTSMGNFLRRPRAPNSAGSGPIWPKFELVRDFMPAIVTCKFEKDLKVDSLRLLTCLMLYLSARVSVGFAVPQLITQYTLVYISSYRSSSESHGANRKFNNNSCYVK